MVKEDENFLRVSLLLLQGGTLVSKETLKIEVKKSGKNIDVLLKPFEKKLFHKTLKRQREKLFPQGSTGTNIEVWDVAMLVTVLLTVFKNSLDDDQKDHLKTIKSIRDEVYAHSPSSSLSNDEYDDIRGKLEKAYLSLSSSIGNDKKNECGDIINKCTNEPISPEDLKRHLENQEDLFQVVLDKMKEHEKNMREMKDAILAKLESMGRKEDRCIKKIKVIDTELTLSGAVNEKDDIDFAERIVTTIINKAIKKAGGDKDDYPKIRKVVEKMLEDIEDLPEVEVLQAVHKCIMLKFECRTYAGLHSILVYLHSDAFRSILKELAVSLNTIPKLKGKQINIDAEVTWECLKNIFDTLNSETSDRDKTIYKRTIRMPIEVKTEEGRRHLWSLFENGGATDRLNELSEAVFEELHTRITVTPSVGSREIEDAVRQTDNQSKRLMGIPDGTAANVLTAKHDRCQSKASASGGSAEKKKNIRYSEMKQPPLIKQLKHPGGGQILKKNITEMNPEERINNPNYLNWIKGTLALMHLCDVVRNYAYHIFDKFLDTISDRPHYNGGSNYIYLARYTVWDSGHWKFTSTHQCVCQSLFKEILRLHFFGDQRIGFTNCKVKNVGGPWGLAKFFMPVSQYCADIETPGETEPSTVLKMIQNCRLFDHIAHANIDIIIGCRNAMMYSPLNNINDADLEKYIDAMVDFLKDAMKSQINSDIRQQLNKAQEEIRELRFADMRVDLLPENAERAINFKKRLVIGSRKREYEEADFAKLGQYLDILDELGGDLLAWNKKSWEMGKLKEFGNYREMLNKAINERDEAIKSLDETREEVANVKIKLNDTENKLHAAENKIFTIQREHKYAQERLDAITKENKDKQA